MYSLYAYTSLLDLCRHERGLRGTALFAHGHCRNQRVSEANARVRRRTQGALRPTSIGKAPVLAAVHRFVLGAAEAVCWHSGRWMCRAHFSVARHAIRAARAPRAAAAPINRGKLMRHGAVSRRGAPHLVALGAGKARRRHRWSGAEKDALVLLEYTWCAAAACGRKEDKLARGPAQHRRMFHA